MRKPSLIRTNLLRAIADGSTTSRELQSACKMLPAHVYSHLTNARKAGLVEVVQMTTARGETPSHFRRATPMIVWGLTERGREEIA
jgi:hypothetical protein